VSPRRLAVSGGEVFFTDEHAVYRVRGRRAVRIAQTTSPVSVPSGLGVVDEHVYFVTIDPDADHRRTLVRVPRAGGAMERLTVVTGSDVARRGREIVVTSPFAPGSLSLYDVDRGTLTTVSSAETVGQLATSGTELVWATGNFYSGDLVTLRRLEAGGPVELWRTDRRLVEGLAVNAAGYYVLLGAHPDAECHEEHRGCGSHPMPPETVCTLPDHRLWFVPR
jgi:hypothetical protein